MSLGSVPRRSLLVIGGAEDRIGRATVLRRFAALAGRRAARIVLVPSASAVPEEVARSYTAVFERLGVTAIDVVNPLSRVQAADPELVEKLDQATGVFISGGNQLKLAQVVLGTPVATAIRDAYTRGAVVGGTSAGASIMSRFMISLGDEGVTPRQRSSQLTAGLGLLKNVVVDQHFDQRARYGRLLSLLASSPNLLGMGVDENTAAEITDDRRLSVLGSGGVFVADMRAALTDAHEARRDAPLLVSGAVVHSLPTGATFDLHTATLVGFVEKYPDVVVGSATR